MGDFYKTIVPLKIKEDQSEQLASKFIRYLQQQSIIKTELSNDVFGKPGYEPDFNFNSILDKNNYYDCFIDGLVITIGRRQVFDNGGNGLERINCPSCGFNIISTNWTDAVQEWFDGKEGVIKCDQCEQNTSIVEFDFYPKWGFGNLGFTFWNCPKLDDNFLKKIEELLEREIIIIEGRI